MVAPGYANVRHVLDETPAAKAARGQVVEIYEAEDGTVSIRFEGADLPFTAFQKRGAAGRQQGQVVPNKVLAGVLDKILKEQVREGAARLNQARTRRERDLALTKLETALDRLT